MKRCNLCKGFKSLFNMQDFKAEWFDCPACEGTGIRGTTVPVQNIAISASQQKVLAKAETRRKKDNANV